MIVHHFNTLTSGGAGGAARRLHESLLDHGVTSKFFYSRSAPDVPIPSFRKFGPVSPQFTIGRRIKDRLNGSYYFRKKYQNMLQHYLKGRPEGYERFSYAKLPYPTPVDWSDERPDVIQLHWISDLIDHPTFFSSIPDELPVVWTLHDMNPFTGGCHYSFECSNYLAECGDCPQLNQNRSPRDLSHTNWTLKWESIRNKNIHVVTVSRWLQKCAQESKLFPNIKSFRTIHLGIDLDVFHPKNKGICRDTLSLDQDAFVIAFGAQSITNRRKGWKEFVAALQLLKIPRILVLLFGEGNIPSMESNSVKCKLMGRIDSPELLSLVYSAADIFAMPSLYENLVQTALEASACETPVVAFRTGGNEDIVQPSTGLLADEVTPEKFAEQIQWMHDHPQERKQMGIAARKYMEQEFTLERQAQNYVELYNSLLK